MLTYPNNPGSPGSSEGLRNREGTGLETGFETGFETGWARRFPHAELDLAATGTKGMEPDGKETSWLPDMDLNHDKQIQSLLCYRYTIGQKVRGQRSGIRA